MPQSSCNCECCKKEMPVPEPKELKLLEAIFFGTPVDFDIPVNTLTEQMMLLNMLTIDLRLFLRLVQLRTEPASQQPMYWAYPQLKDMLHSRLVDIRKLTEQHNPKHPSRHTLSFPHLLYELLLRKPAQDRIQYLKKIEKQVSKVGMASAHIVNKYIVHAATIQSRATTDPRKEQTNVRKLWEHVQILNHVFCALSRYTQPDIDRSLYPGTMRQHITDMRRYVLLTDPETRQLEVVLKDSTDALNAIHAGTTPPPWDAGA